MLASFNKNFSELLECQDEEEQEEDDRRAMEPAQQGARDFREEYFGWLSVVNLVSDTTKSKWDEVWKMSIYEFFNIWSFITWKDKKTSELIRKYGNK